MIMLGMELKLKQNLSTKLKLNQSTKMARESKQGRDHMQVSGDFAGCFGLEIGRMVPEGSIGEGRG